MNQRHLFFIMLAMLTMMLFSCTQTENGNVEYIPFQETKDGQWGMISMDGKVLFKEEFKNKPTVVRDGRFFVRTKEGTWEMYDATEKPKKIGVEYAHTSGFRNGRALVAVKNQPVSIIDTEGKIVKLLDKIEGKIVEGVNAFNGGYAVFLTSDSLEGVINQNGDCVIKPKYCYMNSCGDGKFIAIKTQYKKDIQNDKKEKVKLSVLDTDGKVLFEFSGDKYEDIGQQFVDGKLAVCVKKDGKKYESLVPLPEVISTCMGYSTASKKVQGCFEQMIQTLGTEFDILRNVPSEDIKSCAGERIAEGIENVRTGNVKRIPGYDGEYGKIELFDEN